MIQMLQHYPNLASQAPPPLTEDEFTSLPSVNVSHAALGMCLLLNIVTNNNITIVVSITQVKNKT